MSSLDQTVTRPDPSRTSTPFDPMTGLSIEDVKTISQLNEALDYRTGRLHFLGQDLARLVTATETPAIIFAAARFEDNVRALRHAWCEAGYPADIHFAMKCCYRAEALAAALRAGAGLETMSDIELQLALAAGAPGHQIVAGGAAKSMSYLRRAIRSGVDLVIVDSIEDIVRLEAITEAEGRDVDVAIRIVPGTQGAFIVRDGKLGMLPESLELSEAVRRIGRAGTLRLVGWHGHLLSHCRDPHSYGRAVAAFIDAILMLERRHAVTTRLVNLGGGLESRYLITRSGWNLSDFARLGAAEIARLGREVRVVLEPGRVIAADASIGLASIVGTKVNGRAEWLLVDLCSNVLIPLPDVTYHVLPLATDRPFRRVSVADPTCAPTWIARDTALPEPRLGDIVAITNVGAYTTVFSELWSFALPSLWTINADGTLHRAFAATREADMWKALYGVTIDTDARLEDETC